RVLTSSQRSDITVRWLKHVRPTGGHGRHHLRHPSDLGDLHACLRLSLPRVEGRGCRRGPGPTDRRRGRVRRDDRLRERGHGVNIETWFLVIYFVAMAGIGVATLKMGNRDSEGFLLGGRSLGPAVTALRLQSSSMSGYMFLGAGSLAYTKGYFSLWYAMGDIGG